MNCRHCGANLSYTFLDLGHAPPSNAYLNLNELTKPETYYPLKIKVCDKCWLVQTEDYTKADTLFTSEYAYFSSSSTSWLLHAENYASKMINELSLDAQSLVIEVASNDGYLLKNFVKAGIPCLGIEPTSSTADEAEKLGVQVIKNFFDHSFAKKLAEQGICADLIVGNNVYAHVPDINDFTYGLKAVLKHNGTITLEFPHLMQLIRNAQFDTMYHEHFSYLSLGVVNQIFLNADLRIWHVEELTTHGGSLRIYGCHKADIRQTEISVVKILQEEIKSGLSDIQIYLDFQEKADKIKNDLLTFLLEQKRKGKKVVAYGAAAKGNTLLNYAGIKPDLLPFVCDVAVAKQGKFMPGSHIPILSPEYLSNHQLDYLLILPWNIAKEVKEQNSLLHKNGVRFVTAVPELSIQ
jgi:hypothetical protein